MENGSPETFRMTARRPPGDPVIVIFLAVLALGIFVLRARTETILVYPDAMEYAQLGRSLAAGEGYISKTLWALHTAFSTELPARELRRYPGLPLLESVAFLLTSPSDRAAILAAGIPFILSVPLLYLLARRFLPIAPALAAALLLLFDSRSLDFSVSGLSEPLFALILILLGLALAQKHPLQAAILAGAALGAGQYVRGNAFILMFPLLAAVTVPDSNQLRRPALKQCAAAALAFLFLTAPLLIRNATHLGRLDYTGYHSALAINRTGVHPDHYAERTLEYQSPLAFAREHPGPFLNKVLRDLGLNVHSFAQSASPLIIGIAFARLLLGGWSGPLQRIVIFALGCPVVSVLFYSLGEFEGPRFYVPFVPLLILAAMHSVLQIMTIRPESTNRRISRLILVFLFITALFPGILNLMEPRESQRRGEEFRLVFGREIREYVGEKDVIVSDVPWVTGWYGDRVSVWLPYGPEDMAELGRRLPVRWVCLSAAVRSSEELKPEWRGIYDGALNLPEYTRTATLTGGFVLLKRVE